MLSAEGDVTLGVLSTTGTVNVTSTLGSINEANDDATTKIVNAMDVSLSAVGPNGAVGTGTSTGIEIDSSDVSIEGADFDVEIVTGTDLESLSVSTLLAGSTRSITADDFMFVVTDDETSVTIAEAKKNAGSRLDFVFTAGAGGIIVANSEDAIDTRGDDLAGTGIVTLTADNITQASKTGSTSVITLPNTGTLTLMAGAGSIGGGVAAGAMTVDTTQLALESSGKLGPDKPHDDRAG